MAEIEGDCTITVVVLKFIQVFEETYNFELFVVWMMVSAHTKRDLTIYIHGLRK